MRVSSLDLLDLQNLIRGGEFRIDIAPVVVQLKSVVPSVVQAVRLFYGDREVLGSEGFSDFHVNLSPPRTWRRWWRPQVNFIFDGTSPFKPLPIEQAYPMFEWGLNWCVAQHFNHVVSLHAAVIARDDFGVILPAPPGSGKSTLCAALISRGWRLLSDELALIDPEDLSLLPFPRPVSLKNDSIDLIKSWATGEVFGPRFRDTHKGDVAHMKPPTSSVSLAGIVADPAIIVFPRYIKGSPPILRPVVKPEAVVRLAESGFNYARLGSAAFLALVRLVNKCEIFDFHYSSLQDAVDVFANLPQAST